MENIVRQGCMDSDVSDESASVESSPLEDEESSFSYDEDGELDIANETIRAVGDSIQPYQFEPYLTDPESEISDNNIDDPDMENRLNDTNWCSCGQCNVMPTARECVCCSEVDKVVAVRDEFPNLACVTSHPGFNPVCLDVHVLKVAYFQYRQQYGERPEESNGRQRYTAYRQFVRWCWHYLGNEVRVTLPSCVVRMIRKAFPNPEEDYTGYHSADSDGSGLTSFEWQYLDQVVQTCYTKEVEPLY